MASKYLNRLQGQRVVILGGTSGIGYAIAEASIENSATVIISGSKQDKVDLKVTALQESYPEAAERISGKVCDLSNLEQQESNIVAILDFASNNGAKKLNHIVNTVGDKLHNPPFSELSVEKIQKRLTASSTLFTGGSGTLKPAPDWTLMPVIGGMLETLVRTLAVDMAPIRANGVHPGPVITEFWGGGEKLPEEKAEELGKQVGQGLLTGRAGRVEDLAEAYVYLMKDTNVTGQMILSDGGSVLKS